MAETTKEKAVKKESAQVHENMKQGLLLSLLVIPVGMILWVILWKFGFIASFVSFAVAWLAVYLYSVGAKAPVSRRAAPYVLAVIIVGVLLAFIAGIASDIADFYIEGTSLTQWDALGKGEYWMTLVENLFNNGAMWGAYLVDLAISIGFAFLGCFSVVRELFASREKPVTKKS